MGIVARQLPQPVMSSGGASAGTMTQQQPQANAIQQTNGAAGGKKVLSGGSSGGPTPAGTPVQNGNGQQGPSPPPLTNAPKYGTLVPNRIFVGGISASTTEGELMQLFSAYGTVKAAKIIQDRAGVSKGYGFITFESEDDARRPLRDPDSIVLRERRLNIAPAIKKQPFGRPPAAPPYDGQGQPDGRSPAPAQHQAAMQPPLPPFFFGAAPPFYTSAAAYYATPPVPQMVSNAAQAQVQVSQASQEQAAAAQQAMYQGPPVYPAQTGPPQGNPYASMMFPQTIYMPQQYPMMPYDYTAVYSTGGAPHSNGGVPPQFATAGPPSGGGASPPRGPCYAPQPAPPEATTFLYGPPPPHLFHPAALDPTGGAPGPIYASADGGFDPMGPHAAAMGHFGAMGAPYGMSEVRRLLLLPRAPGREPHAPLLPHRHAPRRRAPQHGHARRFGARARATAGKGPGVDAGRAPAPSAASRPPATAAAASAATDAAATATAAYEPSAAAEEASDTQRESQAAVRAPHQHTAHTTTTVSSPTAPVDSVVRAAGAEAPQAPETLERPERLGERDRGRRRPPPAPGRRRPRGPGGGVEDLAEDCSSSSPEPLVQFNIET